jgi:hypothetical protein
MILQMSVHRIQVSVPLNTGILGGKVTRTAPFEVASDTTFNDFLDQVCRIMVLDPDTAQLGYKFSTDLRRGRATPLLNHDSYRHALEECIRRNARARVHPVLMEIENLVSLLNTTRLCR